MQQSKRLAAITCNRLGLLMAMILCLAPRHAQADTAPPLVDDVSFNHTANALPTGWRKAVSSGGDHTVRRDTVIKQQGQASLHLANQENGARYPRLIREVTLQAGVTYRIFTRVRTTTGRAIVALTPGSSIWYGQSIGSMRVGIPGSDDWREIEWTYTPDETNLYHLGFTLVTPQREKAELWIDQVTVQPYQFDQPHPRIVATTRLTHAGRPEATIIYPADQPAYQVMAQRIVQAVQQQSGVKLPAITDQQATEQRHPILIEPYRRQHLILLGRLDNNRALWPIYNRFKTAVDAYYPGGDGHALHTAASVFQPGQHAIIVGGSSDAGTAQAVDRLVAIIAQQDHANEAELTLPWLLDVQLDGACKAAFDSDERRQLARDFLEPGHDGNLARRFYENVMSWYWSGRQTYLDLALRYLSHILENPVDPQRPRIPAGHYGIEFFVRAYRMIDESGLLTAEQVAAVDELIVNTFHFFSGGREAGYRNAFDQPLYQLSTSDHPNASWMADKVLADFVLDRVPESADTLSLRQAAHRRRDTYLRVFDYLVANRWRGCGKGYAHTDVATRSLFRYALEMERYDTFFDAGNAMQAALYHLARTSNRGDDIGLAFGMTSGITEYRLMLGIVASYTRNAQLAQLVHQMPKIGRVHYGVYVNGVHTYTPPALPSSASFSPLTLPEMPTDSKRRLAGNLLGAWATPMVPDHYRRVRQQAEQADVFVPDLEQTFDLLNIRGGYSKQDDDLLLTGGDTLPAGSLLRLILQGDPWLLHTPVDARYDQNTVQVTVLDQPALDTPAEPPLAHLDLLAGTDAAAWVTMTLRAYNQTNWQRQVIWIKDRLVVVRDRVTAQKPGSYQVTVNWRPHGGSLHSDRWTITANDKQFDMICPSQVMHIQNADVDDNTLDTSMTYRQRRRDTLQAGESIDITNVMMVQDDDQAAAVEVRELPGQAVLVRAGQAGESFYYAGPLPEHLGQTDAVGVILTDSQITVFEATRLTLGSQMLLDQPQPATVTLAVPDPKAMVRELSRLWATDDIAETAGEQTQAVLARQPAERVWRFTAAQRPGLIRQHREGPAVQSPRQIARNTWDLGRPAALVQISSRSDRLPQPIETSLDGEHWRPFDGRREDVASPQVFNYARIARNEQAYQRVVAAQPQAARYVRVQTGHTLPGDALLFYDADQPGTLEPLTLTVADLDGDGSPVIVVHPDIWPGFRGLVQTHAPHEVFVLEVDGQLRWSRLIEDRLLFVRALDWFGTGSKQLFVGALDNYIHVFDAAGQRIHALTVENSGQHHGNPLPNSVGLWQPDQTGRRKMVIPRYHAHSFLHRDGSVEGSARNRSGYWTTDVLPYGIDFTGDGIEDTVSMNSLALLPITQASVSTSTTLTQGGATGIVRLPRSHAALSGSRTLAFKLYQPEQPQLFVARRNMLGIYDLAAERWNLQWLPTVPLGAVATLPNRGQVVAYSRDGLLWRVELNDELKARSVTRTPCDFDIRSLAVLDAERGELLAATDRGLLRLDGQGQAVELAQGDFRHVSLMVHHHKRLALVVDTLGVIECYALD